GDQRDVRRDRPDRTREDPGGQRGSALEPGQVVGASARASGASSSCPGSPAAGRPVTTAVSEGWPQAGRRLLVTALRLLEVSPRWLSRYGVSSEYCLIC